MLPQCGGQSGATSHFLGPLSWTGAGLVPPTQVESGVELHATSNYKIVRFHKDIAGIQNLQIITHNNKLYKSKLESLVKKIKIIRAPI